MAEKLMSQIKDNKLLVGNYFCITYLSSISISLLSNVTYIKTYGIIVEYYQYWEKVYGKGKKVSIMRTPVSYVWRF